MSSSSSSSPRQKIKPTKKETAKPAPKTVPIPAPAPVQKKRIETPVESESDSPPLPKPPTQKTKPVPPPPVTKIEYSESSDSEENKRNRQIVEKNDRRLKPQEKTVVFECAKGGDKLIKVSKNYTVKSDDCIIIIDSTAPVTITLFPIAAGKLDYHVSKRLIIKAVKGIFDHKIVCSGSNCFDYNPLEKSRTFNGLETIRLQSGGNTWIQV